MIEQLPSGHKPLFDPDTEREGKKEINIKLNTLQTMDINLMT